MAPPQDSQDAMAGPRTEAGPHPDAGTPSDDEREGRREAVEEPGRLLRVAHMVRTMLDEVRGIDLDEAGRARLADTHEKAVASLREVLSDDLADELADLRTRIHDGTPSEAELRVAHAQLVGWLEGLFRGIQASLATQQQAAAEQLEQMRRQRALESAGESGPGQYL